MTGAASGPPALVLAGVTGGLVGAGWRVASRSGASGERWLRRNFRDREVSLLLGPAVGAGVLVGIAAAGPQVRRGGLLAVGTAAAVGLYDDLKGDRHARGLLGHARALRSGRVTTGLVKLVALTAAAATGCGRQNAPPVDLVIGTVLVAGGANLINLFDLRPGRAAKVSLIAAAGLAGSTGPTRSAAAVAAGAAVAALPADLGERGMLGDTGAGALGATLGWAAARSGSRRRRAAIAAGIVALTAVSERVSFSAAIDRNQVLRAVDRLGRQPA